MMAIVLLTSSAFGAAQVSFDETNNVVKPRLLIFSGSDWCLPCIRFDKEILQDPVFELFSTQNIEIEILDFPQHKKLNKDKIAYNEKMAERYNPQGYFPHVLLLDHSGKVLTKIETAKATPQSIMEQIKPYLLPKVLKEFSTELILMGSSFRITLVTSEEEGEARLQEAIDKIKEIENWLSSWKPNSITTQLNKEAASTPVEVTEEYYQLVKRCMGISELTQGAFDITFNGLGDLYTFDEKVHELPDHQTIKNHLQHVGFDKIDLLPDRKIWLKDTETTISFGAIGKGYAAEVVKQLMLLNGVHGGVINASGDLTTWGTRANGEPWKVGVPDPDDQSKVLLWLPFENKAIATSGDYEKYFIHEGKRYSHIINPKTGLPVVGSRSVSIISDSAELSDALATAVSVMGLEIGMNLINQLDGVECVFIDSNRNLHFSNGLKKHAY